MKKIISLIACISVIMSISRVADAATARPKIRVGLYETSDPVVVAVNGKSTVGTHVVPTNTVITLSYDSTTALYTATTADWSETSIDPLVIDPINKNKVATVTSYSNPPDWDTSLNDNAFYGSIEFNDGWVVNELGIENYVKGVSEAGNDNEPAYLKALYTAARTYVYFLYLYPTKHAGEPYLVDTTANDQVYRGYGFTSRAPNIVAAVEATVGQIVTYDEEVVVTPYFSQSDGRTRAWSEVWNGDYAYLQSVVDPCCTNETLLGHGVGMSAAGARYFAEEQSWHWREILYYYYQNVELQSMW